MLRCRALLALSILVAVAVAGGAQTEGRLPVDAKGNLPHDPDADPTDRWYRPASEYLKDHTLLHHDGWWHLWSISGVAGYALAYPGNEQTISYHISKDLVNWEFRGHVLHASLREGTFDRSMVWAPHAIAHDGRFYLFYTGVVHPNYAKDYRRRGRKAIALWEDHAEAIGLAVSDDLRGWTKVGDPVRGLGIRGRDPFVVRDDANDRWLLYTTETNTPKPFVHSLRVATSTDLRTWTDRGPCLVTPAPTESMTVMRHPIDGRWIALGNTSWAASDDPLRFATEAVRKYDYRDGEGRYAHFPGVGEMIQWRGRWYRSGLFGEWDHGRLGFTEVAWVRDGLFTVARRSIAFRPEAKTLRRP